MARRACAFKETDVKRALRAVTAAGLITTGVMFSPDGGFRVEIANDNRQPRVNERSAWDEATAVSPPL